MALGEHLRELRSRVTRAAVAIAIGAVAGWFLYEPVFDAVIAPIKAIQERRGESTASINFGDVVSPFNLKIKIALLMGVVLACPVWLYQIWAFITPGLTGKERRYSIGFLAASVPLFLAGCTLAWWVLPKAVEFLNEFVPDGGSTIIDVNGYLSFVTRITLAFGIAFVLPVLLVGLNMARILRGRAMLTHWRVTVFLIFLFAAIATPSPEATSMVVLAGSMTLLFLAAVGISVLNDRRRDARDASETFTNLSDDEASPL